MILKVNDGNRELGMFMRSGIEQVHRRMSPYSEVQPAYDDSLVSRKKSPSDSVWVLFSRTADGREFYMLAEVGSVFIENDEGKTIERF